MNGNRLLLVLLAVLVSGFLFLRIFPSGTKHDAPPSRTAMVEVSVPALEGSAKSGAIAYDKWCTACHGEAAAGQQGVAPPLVHKIYEPGHHGDQSFHLAAERGVRAHHWQFGDMPVIDGITDTEIAEVIAYVRTLQRANGIQ